MRYSKEKYDNNVVLECIITGNKKKPYDKICIRMTYWKYNNEEECYDRYDIPVSRGYKNSLKAARKMCMLKKKLESFGFNVIINH